MPIPNYNYSALSSMRAHEVKMQQKQNMFNFLAAALNAGSALWNKVGKNIAEMERMETLRKDDVLPYKRDTYTPDYNKGGWLSDVWEWTKSLRPEDYFGTPDYYDKEGNKVNRAIALADLEYSWNKRPIGKQVGQTVLQGKESKEPYKPWLNQKGVQY